jgi:hypothetical protein
MAEIINVYIILAGTLGASVWQGSLRHGWNDNIKNIIVESSKGLGIALSASV